MVQAAWWWVVDSEGHGPAWGLWAAGMGKAWGPVLLGCAGCGELGCCVAEASRLLGMARWESPLRGLRLWWLEGGACRLQWV